MATQRKSDPGYFYHSVFKAMSGSLSQVTNGFYELPMDSATSVTEIYIPETKDIQRKSLQRSCSNARLRKGICYVPVGNVTNISNFTFLNPKVLGNSLTSALQLLLFVFPTRPRLVSDNHTNLLTSAPGSISILIH